MHKVYPLKMDIIRVLAAQAVTSTAVSLLNKQATSMITAILVSLAMSLQVIFMLIAQYTVLKHIQPGRLYYLKKSIERRHTYIF